MRLIRGKIVTDAMVRNAENSVKKHFVKKGFLNTQVKITRERDTLNRGGVRLRIDVDVRSKVKINNISFEGNEKISAATLRKKLKKRTNVLASPFIVPFYPVFSILSLVT